MKAAMRSNTRYDDQLFPVSQHLDHALQSYVAANIGTWESLALSADQSHLLFSYGEESSYALMYNLFSDRLLGTNIVPQSVSVDFHILQFEPSG